LRVLNGHVSMAYTKIDFGGACKLGACALACARACCSGVFGPMNASCRKKSRVSRLSWRRGVTLVEVICAVTLLAVAAAAILNATGAIVSSQGRGQKRLGAAELANRLLLQYLDDENSLPSEALPIDYAGDSFRWSKKVTPITLNTVVPQEARAGNTQSGMGLDRLRAVTVTVWLIDEQAGQMEFVAGTPAFALTRIVDPLFGPLRNPDTREKLFNDPVAMRRFIDQFTGRSPAPAEGSGQGRGGAGGAAGAGGAKSGGSAGQGKGAPK